MLHRIPGAPSIAEEGTWSPLTERRSGCQLVGLKELCFLLHTTPIAFPPQTLSRESNGHFDCPVLALPILVPSSSPHVKALYTSTPDIPGTADTAQPQTQAPRSTDATLKARFLAERLG